MRIEMLVVPFLLVVQSLFAQIQVSPLNPTPFNENIKINAHTTGCLDEEKPIYVRVRSFPLGVKRVDDQLGEMRRLPQGSHVLIIVNGTHRTHIVRTENTPLVEDQNYFTKSYTKTLPSDVTGKLRSGPIVVTMITLTAYGESVKTASAMETNVICYKSVPMKNPGLDKKLEQPYILYNEPYGTFPGGIPILLDYIAINSPIGPNANQVQVWIDDKLEATLDNWIPYKITGLPKGDHKISLVLINENGKPIPNPFCPQETTITVGDPLKSSPKR